MRDEFPWYLLYGVVIVAIIFAAGLLDDRGRHAIQVECLRAGHPVAECKELK